jgi:hypothetical protein
VLGEERIRARVGMLDLLDDLAKLRRLTLGADGTIRIEVDGDPSASGLRQVHVRWERPREEDHEFLSLSVYASFHLDRAITLLEEAVEGGPTRIVIERNGGAE